MIKREIQAAFPIGVNTCTRTTLQHHLTYQIYSFSLNQRHFRCLAYETARVGGVATVPLRARGTPKPELLLAHKWEGAFWLRCGYLHVRAAERAEEGPKNRHKLDERGHCGK